MFSYHGTSGQSWTLFCVVLRAVLPVGMASGHRPVWAAMAHWLARSAGRLAGAARVASARLGTLVAVVAVCHLDSVARMVVHVLTCASC